MEETTSKEKSTGKYEINRRAEEARADDECAIEM